MKENNNRNRADKPKKDFEEVLLEVRRVTRVTTGGRRMSFRAIVLIGNKKGKIGLGVAKGPDVAIAVRKATQEAYKAIVVAPISESDSVPYPITHKYKSAIIKIVPAAPGTGLKAGSSLRTVLNLVGYLNVLTKIIGTNNKLNNAIACIQALALYKASKKSSNKVKVFSQATAHEESEKVEETTKETSVPAKKKPTLTKKTVTSKKTEEEAE
ncbi:MAG TPA: hypothetical protein PKD96_03535 [Candidatus Absconditabacterales bacterium]|nr:hypothetical protein [Candidatus Absconditabacterales bacterium]